MIEAAESASGRRSGAILVAPLEAAWPEQASAFLTARGYAVARMNALSLIGFLVSSAGVAGILIDSSILATQAAVACVGAMRRVQAQIALVVVGPLTETEAKRIAAARVTAVLPAPPALTEIARWFPDLRTPAPATART